MAKRKKLCIIEKTMRQEFKMVKTEEEEEEEEEEKNKIF